MGGKEERARTLCSGGMLVQHTTTPLKGTDGSKRSAPPGGESGGVAMAGRSL